MTGQDAEIARLVEQLADALDAVLHAAHPVSPTTARGGGAGGMTITMHCDLGYRPEIVEQAEVALRLANRDANWWPSETRKRQAAPLDGTGGA